LGDEQDKCSLLIAFDYSATTSALPKHHLDILRDAPILTGKLPQLPIWGSFIIALCPKIKNCP
jgi:hypothetical protein